MPSTNSNTVDIHVHVGRLGVEHPELGQMSDWYRQQLVFKVMLLYLHLKESDLTDARMQTVTLQTIAESSLSKIVCLALDPVFDSSGKERKDLSHIWVSNDYVRQLQQELPDRILFGASVHPYDPDFRERVNACVEQGAVLLKWLPSAQQINLADDRVRSALLFLAQARQGKPLPLLLHIGPEYAIPSSDTTTTSYDFLSWSIKDRFTNFFRFGHRWRTPDVAKTQANLHAGLEAGATIIFAHVGLPYFASGTIGSWLEHGEFEVIRDYLCNSHDRKFSGRCFSDISAICTPVRRRFYDQIAALPPETLLYGSDFPCPTFELASSPSEREEDFRAILHGELSRVAIPDGNLLDVNLNQMQHFFPNHPVFSSYHTLHS